MEFWRIAQIIYLLFSLIGTGILTIALVTVAAWPQIRGRGLLLIALAMKLVATVGYLAVLLIQQASAFEWLGVGLSGEVMQVGYVPVALIGLAGDGLLLLALISLASALRDAQLRGGGLTSTSPPGLPKEF